MFKSIQETHAQLKSKKISALELTKSFLEKAKKNTTNSYLLVNEEKAHETAKQIDQKIAKGEQINLLDGIPLGLKDLYLTKGIRTTAASKILENYIPFTESFVSQKLKDAGSVLIGKLNMDEFAMGSNNEFSAFGPCKNPWKLTNVSGGSSGGSAACIADGSALLSLGSDTGGSIRLPASYCGVVGIKPSYGRCSRYGMVSFASSLDQAGCLARNVFDAALGLETIMGHDPMDSTCLNQSVPKITKALEASSLKDLSSKKIGIPKGIQNLGLSKDILNSYNKLIDELKKLGCAITEVDLPLNDQGITVYYLVAVSEASSNLSRYDGVRYTIRAKNYKDISELYCKSRAEGFGEEVKRRIILGTFALSAGYYDAYYLKACKVRRTIQKSFQDAFTKVDLLITPVNAQTAPKIGEQIKDPLSMYLNDTFTIPVSLAGLPAMSIPFELDSNKMPIGFQLIGKYLGEENLMTSAYQIEKHFGTHNFLDRQGANHGI